jgi:lipopolysaccharide assembly outer membrane protein LptD (OstA)
MERAKMLSRFPSPILALASIASAQDPPPPPTGPPVPSSQTPPVQDPLKQKPTLEPTGHPGLPEKDSRLPSAQEGVPQEIRIISSEQFINDGTILKIRGAVHVQYRGYDIYAREVDLDRTTNVMILRGGAQLIGKDAVVLGETITVDFNAETFRVLQTAAEIRPGLLEGRTLENVYLIGGDVYGSEREVIGHNCGLTTCVYDKPHYLLDSREIVLRPRKRVILRDVRLEILGHTVLKIP